MEYDGTAIADDSVAMAECDTAIVGMAGVGKNGYTETKTEIKATPEA